MFALWLYPKLSISTTLYQADLTPWARSTWRRTTRALGGYWTGEFSILPGTMTRHAMWTFYHNNIGRRVVENTFGMTTWEGEIIEMTITIDGVSYTTTLDTDRWHNKVKTQYTHPRIEDVQQGNLNYDTDGAGTFEDDGQDFSDWDTAAPGDAVYRLDCYNDDDTGADGFLGDISTPNTVIDVYKDRGLTTQGWNGATAGKTCSTYTISSVEDAGVAKQTAWSETTDSSDQYGESCYIDVRGEMPLAAAEGIRDRRLTENAYPKSVPTGGLSTDAGGAGQSAQLDVICAGYVFSMNRRFMESDVIQAAASTQVGVLVDGSADAAEFVTTGTIDSNTGVTPAIMCSEMSMRLWDLCEEICEMGDGSGNRWIAGVYDRKLDYKAAETSVTRYWRNGRLTDAAGHPVYPTLIEPDTIVRVDDVLWGVTSGGGNAWQNMRQFYVEEVEFQAPRAYRLIPYEGEAFALASEHYVNYPMSGLL